MKNEFRDGSYEQCLYCGTDIPGGGWHSVPEQFCSAKCELKYRNAHPNREECPFCGLIHLGA